MIARKVIEEKPLETFEVESLIPGSKIPFDVYIKDKGILIHYLSKGALFTVGAREDLKNRGIKKAYVQGYHKDQLEEYITKKGIIRIPSLESPLNFQKYCQIKEKHFQIDKSILLSSIPVPFRVYMADRTQFKEIITINEKPNEILDLTDIEGDLLIRKQDIGLYIEYLRTLTKERPDKDNNTQYITHREHAKAIIKNLFEDPKQGENTEPIKETVNNIIESLIDNKDRVYDSLVHKGLDLYTYNHSLNVTILCIRMAIEIGLKKSEIENLALGALLHDIGHSVISQEIVNKQGRLNSNEYKIFRMHVTEGEKILRGYKNIHEDTFIPLLQHHEKLTGNGYPLKLKGKDIKLYGRITAIADCYDSLTTNRPFRVANTPFYALSIIAKETGDFDPTLLKIFIKMLGNIR